jgi:hypothetical protein
MGEEEIAEVPGLEEADAEVSACFNMSTRSWKASGLLILSIVDVKVQSSVMDGGQDSRLAKYERFINQQEMSQCWWKLGLYQWARLVVTGIFCIGDLAGKRRTGHTHRGLGTTLEFLGTGTSGTDSGGCLEASRTGKSQVESYTGKW